MVSPYYSIQQLVDYCLYNQNFHLLSASLPNVEPLYLVYTPGL